MYEEQRLVSIGFPLEDAVSVCHALRKDGNLDEFVEAEENNHRNHVCHCFGKCAHCTFQGEK